MSVKRVIAALGLLLLGASVPTGIFLVRDRNARLDAERVKAAAQRAAASADDPSRRIDERNQRIVAGHEAGHAVVFAALFGVKDILRVAVHGKLDANEHFGLTVRGCAAVRDADEWRAEMVGYLGSIAAEQLLFRKRSDASTLDLFNARNIAVKIHYFSGLGKSLFVHNPEIPVTVEPQLIEGELTRALQRAEAILRHNEKTVRALADELFVNTRMIGGRRVMDRAAFLKFIAKHPITLPKSEARSFTICDYK
jgi:ATP-dependent Zn protease